MIAKLTKKMNKAAAELNFEEAAELRDELKKYKIALRDYDDQKGYNIMSEKKEYIRIRGAREHNLKNINIDIPRNEFVVLTGLSGSGKSSLAFDTIYAEGQRRYTGSFSCHFD